MFGYRFWKITRAAMRSAFTGSWAIGRTIRSEEENICQKCGGISAEGYGKTYRGKEFSNRGTDGLTALHGVRARVDCNVYF